MPQSSAAGKLGEHQPFKNMAQGALNQHGEFNSGPLSGTDFYGDKQTSNQTTNIESVHYSKILLPIEFCTLLAHDTRHLCT